jgi:hypothetical protein
VAMHDLFFGLDWQPQAKGQRSPPKQKTQRKDAGDPLELLARQGSEPRDPSLGQDQQGQSAPPVSSCYTLRTTLSTPRNACPAHVVRAAWRALDAASLRFDDADAKVFNPRAGAEKGKAKVSFAQLAEAARRPAQLTDLASVVEAASAGGKKWFMRKFAKKKEAEADHAERVQVSLSGRGCAVRAPGDSEYRRCLPLPPREGDRVPQQCYFKVVVFTAAHMLPRSAAVSPFHQPARSRPRPPPPVSFYSPRCRFLPPGASGL